MNEMETKAQIVSPVKAELITGHRNMLYNRWKFTGWRGSGQKLRWWSVVIDYEIDAHGYHMISDNGVDDSTLNYIFEITEYGSLRDRFRSAHAVSFTISEDLLAK
jgi:hypothetical protein